MYHPRLKGSHAAMGQHYGKLLYKHGFRMPALPEYKIDFGRKALPELRSFYPEIVDEIRAFAEAVHTDWHTVLGFLLSIGVFEMAGQCSIFAFCNDDHTIFGRNYDFLNQHRAYCESSLVCATNKYAFIGQGDVFIGKMDGINEKGLAIGMNFVNGKEIKAGISFPILVRYILEHCATTKEAIEVLCHTPTCNTYNYLVADRNGHIAAVERTPSSYAIRTPKQNEQFIYTTNQFLATSMRSFDHGNIHWSKSQERTTALQNYLQDRDHISIDAAKALLSDKSCALCMDLRKEQFSTLYSIVANLNESIIHRAERKPTPKNYIVDKRLENVLKKR